MYSKNKTLVSIIVPIYNSSKYLTQCLDSIYSQTHKDIEVILINDGSTDHSLNIIKEYVKSYPKTVVINKSNGGLSSARNAGIKKANGDYLCFVDSDDIISPVFTEELLKNINPDEGALVSCCQYTRRLTKLPSTRKSISNRTMSSRQYLLNTYYQKKATLYSVTVATKMFAASLFRNTNFPVGKLYEDFAIIDQLLLQSAKIGITKQPLYYYRHTNNSITTKCFEDSHLDTIEHCNTLIRNYSNVKDIYRSLIVMKYTRCLEMLTKAKQSKKEEGRAIQQLRSYIKIHWKEVLKNPHSRITIKIACLFSSIHPDIAARLNIAFRKIKGILR